MGKFRQEPLGGRRRILGPVDEGNTEPGGQTLEVGDVLDELLVSFRPNPKTVMSWNETVFLLARTARKRRSPPRRAQVFWWLIRISATGVSTAPKHTQGTTCDQGSVNELLSHQGEMDEILIRVELAARCAFVQKPIRRDIDPKQRHSAWSS